MQNRLLVNTLFKFGIMNCNQRPHQGEAASRSRFEDSTV